MRSSTVAYTATNTTIGFAKDPVPASKVASCCMYLQTSLTLSQMTLVSLGMTKVRDQLRLNGRWQFFLYPYGAGI